MSKDALVKNAADPEQVSAAVEQENFIRNSEVDDLLFVLSTVQGRRFIWRLLGFCGVRQTVYATDPHHTYFLEGKRTVGLKLHADIEEHRPEAYLEMINENKSIPKGKKQ